MIDPAKLTAFAAITGLVSMVPGPQVIFVLSQAAWRGPKAGAVALAGLQLGNAVWFVLAGLGLGALALAWPHAFTALTMGGALYLGWLGLQAWRHATAAAGEGDGAAPARARGGHPLRDSLAVAFSNPKQLVYMLALLPPFVDSTQPVAPQMAALAAVAIALDTLVGGLYVAAGGGLAAAMRRPAVRLWLERGIGITFLLLAALIIGDLVRRGGALG